jgi:uncharacterized membrane protein
MTITLLISLVFFVVLGIGTFVFWLLFREKNKTAAASPQDSQPAVSFSWSHITLPIALLVLSIVLAVVFYPKLTAEVAYRFDFDGSPRNLAGRQAVVLVTLLGQLILALMACAIVWGATKLSGSSGQAGGARSTRMLVLVMGNMVAVPQLVIGFVMADIFGYNVYGRHLLPLWAFALAVMLLAGVVLVIFFVKIIRRSMRGG